jgi:hypothetical protein
MKVRFIVCLNFDCVSAVLLKLTSYRLCVMICSMGVRVSNLACAWTLVSQLYYLIYMRCSRASPRSNPGLVTVRCFVIESSVVLSEMYHLEAQQ